MKLVNTLDSCRLPLKSCKLNQSYPLPRFLFPDQELIFVLGFLRLPAAAAVRLRPRAAAAAAAAAARLQLPAAAATAAAAVAAAAAAVAVAAAAAAAPRPALQSKQLSRPSVSQLIRQSIRQFHSYSQSIN